MGSDETAITIPGGARVIDVFDGNGCHRVQIIYFFGRPLRSRTPSGLGLTLGSRLERVRRFLVLPESSGSKTLAFCVGDIWLEMHLGRCI